MHVLSRCDNLKRHEITCKKKTLADNENIKLKEELQELKNIIKDLLNSKCKMNYKTFEKMQNKVQITNIGTVNNINTIVNQNINITPLGNENLEKVFSESEKLSVINKKYGALNYIIEYTHFNDKFPQFQNIFVTNQKNNVAYMYNTKNNMFNLVSKDTLIDDLIDFRVCDIEDFYLEHEDKLDEHTKHIMKDIAKNRYDSKKTTKDVGLLLFNNSKKLNKDILV
jgi:hypothetical protein